MSELNEQETQAFEQMQNEDSAVVEQPEEPQVTEQPAEVEPVPEKRDTKVPHQALHEERERRKDAERRVQEAEQRYQRDMQLLNERLQRIEKPPVQIPDVQTDPVTNFDHRIGQLAQKTDQVLQQTQEWQQAQQRQQVIANLAQGVMQDAAVFKSTTPDFNDAYDHLNSMRTRELVALGVPEDAAKAKAVRELDEACIVWKHEGRNPAQVAYSLAQARGYTVKTQTDADKIASQQKGVAAAKTIGGGGGTQNGLSAQALLAMSDEEFAKVSETDFRRAMGG